MHWQHKMLVSFFVIDLLLLFQLTDVSSKVSFGWLAFWVTKISNVACDCIVALHGSEMCPLCFSAYI